MSSAAHTPLARLLGMAFRQMVDDLHAALVARGWTDVRESYGFVLLAVRDQQTTTTELAAILGVSKQATSKLLDAMESCGFISRDARGDDARVKTVALAGRGRELLEVVEEIYAEIEAGWAAIIGETALAQTRHRLERVVRERHGGELPALRPA